MGLLLALVLMNNVQRIEDLNASYVAIEELGIETVLETIQGFADEAAGILNEDCPTESWQCHVGLDGVVYVHHEGDDNCPTVDDLNDMYYNIIREF